MLSCPRGYPRPEIALYQDSSAILTSTPSALPFEIESRKDELTFKFEENFPFPIVEAPQRRITDSVHLLLAVDTPGVLNNYQIRKRLQDFILAVRSPI